MTYSWYYGNDDECSVLSPDKKKSNLNKIFYKSKDVCSTQYACMHRDRTFLNIIVYFIDLCKKLKDQTSCIINPFLYFLNSCKQYKYS